MSPRIFTIVGATGAQGSAVVDAVLADGTFTPRAISRSVDSEKSKALAARGVEVVAANLFDKESVKKAFRGSEVVFGVTNFWDPAVFPADPKGAGEITQGKNLAEAAKEEGVKYFLWSSLPNITELTNGLYKHVYHCDNKALVDTFLQEAGVPHSVVYTGWFAENLWNFGSLVKAPDGGDGYIIPIPKYGPEDSQSATWVKHDLGQAVLALAKNYNTEKGKEVGVLGGKFPVVSLKFTYPEFAAAISKGIKKPVTFVPVETAGMAELDEMFLFQAKYNMYADTAFPNPKLVALGVKFGSMDEFVTTEVVPRFA
ncbi:NmrA domain-containing protein [Mycena chlorophos]|uniref:NmrA domain-containing protein n=1 Tax=Mycena chlorophos TaxID=658473 RepID=A0A8H6WKS7_MYCCL|nr:NmrA domain-containing protein [Mycena chlorophos]